MKNTVNIQKPLATSLLAIIWAGMTADWNRFLANAQLQNDWSKGLTLDEIFASRYPTRYRLFKQLEASLEASLKQPQQEQPMISNPLNNVTSVVSINDKLVPALEFGQDRIGITVKHLPELTAITLHEKQVGGPSAKFNEPVLALIAYEPQDLDMMISNLIQIRANMTSRQK
jgi:hypothetical protein